MLATDTVFISIENNTSHYTDRLEEWIFEKMPYGGLHVMLDYAAIYNF